MSHSQKKEKDDSTTTEVSLLPDYFQHTRLFQSSWPWSTLSDTFVPELLATMLSIACCTVIGVLLKVWSNKPVPQLGNGVTTNAVVSVLATISKSAMMFVVTACIAQNKWIWFRKARPLIQIQTIDNAGRGPLGALLLFTSTAWLSLASLGAVITILTLAFDPFLQQAISYPLQPVSAASPGVAVNRSVLPMPATVDNDILFEPADLTLALAGQDTFLPQPQCNSANCTWPDYRTLSICTSCEARVPKVEQPWHWKRLVETEPVFYNLVTLDLGDVGSYVINAASVNCSQSGNLDGNVSSVHWNTGNYTWSSTDVCLFSAKIISSTIIEGTSLGSYKPWRSVTLSNHTELNLQTKVQVGDIEYPLGIIAFTSILWTDEGPQFDNTTVCAYDFCAQRYDISVVNQKTSVQLLESETRFGQKYSRYFESQGDLPPINTTCWEPYGSHDVQYVVENYTDQASALPSYLATPVYCPVDKHNLAFCICSDVFDVSGALVPTDNSVWGVMSILEGNISGNTGAPGNYWSAWPQDPSVNSNASVELYQWLELASSPSLIRTAQPQPLSLISQDYPIQTTFEYEEDLRLRTLYGLQPEVAVKRITDYLAAYSRNNSTLSDEVQGLSVTMLPHVLVRWPWLTLPAILNCATAILLVLTIYLTNKHKTPLWKTSLIAAFFHGIENDLEQSELAHNYARASQMDSEAARSKVRLRPNYYGNTVLGKEE